MAWAIEAAMEGVQVAGTHVLAGIHMIFPTHQGGTPASGKNFKNITDAKNQVERVEGAKGEFLKKSPSALPQNFLMSLRDVV